MIIAMECNGGIFRVENEETGRVEIFDDYAELTQYYNPIGVLS